MSNFTVAIPDDLLTDAKVMAAKAGTSVNAIIRNLLDGFVQNESSPMTGNFEILLQYSLGQLTAKKAVKLLHMEDEANLQALTLKAGFPLPRISLQETEVMKKRFGEMLNKASA
ncbi:MAG: hypothetical protein RL063_1919 [Pseudomonadota bacterium]|jgi:plasmid stability protein